MVYVNQIQLFDYGVECNKKFLELMFGSTDFENARKLFEFLDVWQSFARQSDDSMSFQEFLNLLNGNFTATLQFNSPIPFEINYGVIVSSGSIEKFAFVEMPFTDSNFKVVSEYFNSSFGFDIESIGAAQYLRDNYEKAIDSGF